VCSEDDVSEPCVGSWVPQATVIPSQVDSSVNVSFDPAPSCYRFSAYNVSLVDIDSGDLYIIIQRVTLYQPRNHVCQ